MTLGVLFGSLEWVQLIWPQRPCSPNPVDQPAGGQRGRAGAEGARSGRRVSWARVSVQTRLPSVLCGTILVALITTFCFPFQSCAKPFCSSGKTKSPQLEKFKVFLFVWTPGSENIEDICALCAPFPSLQPRSARPQQHLQRCIVHIPPRLDLVLTACLL